MLAVSGMRPFRIASYGLGGEGGVVGGRGPGRRDASTIRRQKDGSRGVLR
jgi:hypothetical protein